MALLAYEEAARLYVIALESLDSADPSDERGRCELLLAIGEARARPGSTPAAKQTFLDAAAIARSHGLGQDLARAAAGYGGHIVWGRAGDDDQLVLLLEEGLAALSECDVALRVRLLTRLAGALRDEPSRERRDVLSAQAVALAGDADEPAILAYALSGRANAIVAPDTIDEVLTVSEELLALAQRIGDSEAVVQARNTRCIARLYRGDIAAGGADLAASQIAHGLRQPALIWLVDTALAMLATAQGRLDDAEQLVEQVFAVGEHAEPDAALAVVGVQRYTLCDFRGRRDEDLLRGILKLGTMFPARPVLRCVAAHACVRFGREAEARQALGELADDGFSGVPFDQEWLFAMSLLAETTALLQDTDRAATLCHVLSPWGHLNAVDQAEGIRGSVSRYLGLLETTLGHWDDAERHYEAALSMNAAMQLRPWLAHTQTDYARMLNARHRPGDDERASSLRDAAVQTYRQLGMQLPSSRSPIEGPA